MFLLDPIEELEEHLYAVRHRHGPALDALRPGSDVRVSAKHQDDEGDVRDEHVRAALLKEVHPHHALMPTLIWSGHIVRDDERQAVAERSEQLECLMDVCGADGVPSVRSRGIEQHLANTAVLKEEEY